MNSKTQWQGILTTIMVAWPMLAGCSGDDAARAGAKAPANEVLAAAAAATLVGQVGIEPGPVQQTAGALAVLAKLAGTVEVRRLGEELFAPAKQDQALYLGDQVRAGDGAQATILFADQSTVELAEVSTLAIGSRATTADPASSAAVLAGVARFSVTPRAPGEGPFMVFTAAGVVATKGTVFGVGVAADGTARVGVEEGAVEVAGAAALDVPVTLAADGALELAGTGKLKTPSAWREDDWGSWRAQAEADLDANATAALHGTAMTSIASELEANYGVLTNLSAPLAKFDVAAAADAQANATAHYEANLPEATLAIEASYLAALRLEFLTHAYLSRAVLASDLYVRHPQIEAWAVVEPRVQAAVLWPKRFDVVANAYLEPLRAQYYLHHPRGRVNAQFVGVAVPQFYASVTPPAVPRAALESELAFTVFTPPTPKFVASARAIWISAPSADWQANVNARAAAARAKRAFYVRPPKLAAKAIFGAQVKGKLVPVFVMKPPRVRGQLDAKWGLALGHSIELAAPDLQAAAHARAHWNAEAPSGSLDVDSHEGLDLHAAKADLHGAKAKLNAQGQAKLAAASKLEAKAKAVSAAVGAAKAEGKGRAKAGFKLEAPEFKAPSVKAEAKGSASFKLGR